jgi:opacity protein-like surface antigen
MNAAVATDSGSHAGRKTIVIRQKWSSIVAFSLLCLLASQAHAGEPGFYLLATGGTGDEDPKSNGTNFGNSLGVIHVDPDQVEVNDGSFSWGIGLGYRINDYFAAEVEYADFGTTDVREHYTVPNAGPIPFPTELDLAYSSKITGPVLSVLGMLPVHENLELFVRGGVLFASREYSLEGQLSFGGQDQKFASTVWVAGAGATWSFAARWGVRAEYQQSGALEETLLTGATRVKRITLSALYRF